MKIFYSAGGGLLPSCKACKVPRPIGGGSWRPSGPSWKGCTPVLGDQYSNPLRAGCNLDWKEKEWDCILWRAATSRSIPCFEEGSLFNRNTMQTYPLLCSFGQYVYGVSQSFDALRCLIHREHCGRLYRTEATSYSIFYPFHRFILFTILSIFAAMIFLEICSCCFPIHLFIFSIEIGTYLSCHNLSALRISRNE